MRLIEKKCPNCGASLSFAPEDVSCKCEYCKREFEIERDTDQKKLSDQFNLSELKTPFKIFSYFTIGSFIAQAVIFIIVFIIIAIIAFNIIKGFNDSDSIFNRNASLVTDVSDLSKGDFNSLDLNSKIIISKETAGATTEYRIKGNLKREKLYIISNDKKNMIITVYKAIYKKFPDYSEEFSHTVYIPIKYEDVRSKYNSISLYLDDGEIVAPEYYFNLEHSEYSYGYKDMETLYNELIKQYEKDYTIKEK